MKRRFDFASIRIGLIRVLSIGIFLAAVPHPARLSPQPLIVNTSHQFRATYLRPNLSASIPAQSDKPHTLAASYYSLQGNLKSSLTLNNKGLLSLEVTPTLFNLDGQRLDLPPVTVDATSFQVFDLAEWAGLGGPTFQQGSLQLFYRGKDLLLGAQVKIIDSGSSLIFDEQMTEPKAMFSSSHLEGLWWLPDNHSQVRIAISNTTDSIHIASLQVEGVAPKQQGAKELILQPHQTLLIDPAQDLSDKPTVLMKAGGISINHFGAPGSLIARAMIENPSVGFSSAFQFADPRMAKSSRLHGAGLRLADVAGEEMAPVVTARNISGRTAVLRGRISYTKSDGSRGAMPLREIQMRAGEVKAWEIIVKSEGIKSAGLEMDYDTQPGSVIVSALSVSRSGNQVFQMPMLDAGVQKSSTGVYPFSLEGGSSTVAYIKNTTGVEQKYVAHLNYEGGDYMMGVKSLAGGETAAIDIRALRDNQVVDGEGRTIPEEITQGQIRWTIIQSEGTDLLALIGRAEQTDEARTMSSTYACQNCCGDFAEDVFITPSQVEMQAGQAIFLQAFEMRSDCYGFTYPVPQSASWSSSNSSVASVSDGQVTANTGGETTIRATWNSFSSVATQCNPGSEILGPPDPIGTSCCRSVTNFRSVTATVRVVPRVFISEAQTIMDGDTASFSIQSPDATPSSITWSHTVPTGAGNNPSVVFSSANGMATQTDGHWFALPNRECPATACASTYNILCTVDFSLGFNVRVMVSTSLTVSECRPRAGQVDPNEATIVGGPATGFNSATGRFVVVDMGSMTRVVPRKVVFVPPHNQFFAKADAHEQAHLDHFQPGNIFGNVFQPADFFARIRNFTDTTREGLVAQIANEFGRYSMEQRQILANGLRTSEQLAFQVSDPIPPRYIYQNCGRF